MLRSVTIQVSLRGQMSIIHYFFGLLLESLQVLFGLLVDIGIQLILLLHLLRVLANGVRESQSGIHIGRDD